MSDAQDFEMKTLNDEDKKRIKHAIDLGVTVAQEVADLKEGLKETIVAVAEELKIKPSTLNKAIRVAFKNSMKAQSAEVETIGELLDAAGRGE